MISVVICSVNKALAAQVKRNIDSTIGVPWELIILDNAVLKKGITEVYNMGARQAKFDIFCFVHEDVLFRTQNWGSLILGYFGGDKTLGLVGVAGSKYKAKTPSGWVTGIADYDCCNILHLDSNGVEERIYLNPDESKVFQEVVTLDGVFICATREAWSKVTFNEEMLKGFHLYDIDFSLSVALSYRVAVTLEIDLVHLTSGGDFGDAWVENTLKWHEAKDKLLPFVVRHCNVNNRNKTEKCVRLYWLNRLKIERVSFKNRLKWLAVSKAYSDITLVPKIVEFMCFRSIKRVLS